RWGFSGPGGALAARHRAVGRGYELGGCSRVARVEARADAARDADHTVSRQPDRRCDRTLDPRRDRRERLAAGTRLEIGEQEEELVAADAGDHVVRVPVARQPAGDGLEQLVACGVPVAVVDLLEAVEVDVDDADRGPVTIRVCERDR